MENNLTFQGKTSTSDVTPSVKATLEKIRKWSVAGITPKQLLEVIPYFRGWTFTKDVIYVQCEYIDMELRKDFNVPDIQITEGPSEDIIKFYDFVGSVLTDWKERLTPELVKRIEEENKIDRQVITDLHKTLKKLSGVAMPPKAKKDQYYVSWISDLQESVKDNFIMLSFEAKVYRGSIGFCIEQSDGKSYEHSDMRKIWQWLKDHSHMKEEAAEILGVGVHIPANQRTRDNTGTCPVCFVNYKLTNQKMVLHGFQRPGDGHVLGYCAGVDWPPYELSPIGCQNCIDNVLIPRLKKSTQYLQDILDEKIKSVHIDGITIDFGDPKFSKTLKRVQSLTESSIRSSKVEISIMKKRIKDWTPKPLP